MNIDPYESHWREQVPPITLLEEVLEDEESEWPRFHMRFVQNDCGS